MSQSSTPIYTYSPELNPVEQVWAYLRANFLSHRVWNSYDAIVDACCDAWNKLMNMPERLASITRRTWARAATAFTQSTCGGDHALILWSICGLGECVGHSRRRAW